MSTEPMNCRCKIQSLSGWSKSELSFFYLLKNLKFWLKFSLIFCTLAGLPSKMLDNSFLFGVVEIWIFFLYVFEILPSAETAIYIFDSLCMLMFRDPVLLNYLDFFITMFAYVLLLADSLSSLLDDSSSLDLASILVHQVLQPVRRMFGSTPSVKNSFLLLCFPSLSILLEALASC